MLRHPFFLVITMVKAVVLSIKELDSVSLLDAPQPTWSYFYSFDFNNDESGDIFRIKMNTSLTIRLFLSFVFTLLLKLIMS